MGNSFGCWVVSWAALQAPANLNPKNTKLILLGSVGLKSNEPLLAQNKTQKIITVDDLKEFQQNAYCKPRTYDDDFWQKAIRRAHQSNTLAVRAAQTADDYLDSALKSLKFKTTYYWGSCDKVVPKTTGQAFSKLTPLVLFETIQECGHMPQKECVNSVAQILNQQAQ